MHTKTTPFKYTLCNYFDGDDDLWEKDILVLVGTQSKEQKSKYIGMYMDETYGNSMKPPSIIYATSGVGSAGIDSPNIILVFRIDMPPSIFGLFQEKGRSGRHPLASAGDH